MAGVHLGFALAALRGPLGPGRRHPRQAAGALSRPGAKSTSPATARAPRSPAWSARIWLTCRPVRPPTTPTRPTPSPCRRPGNAHYASEYNAAFANGGMAFCVSNSQDWVPQVPLTLESLGDVNTPNPVSVCALRPDHPGADQRGDPAAQGRDEPSRRSSRHKPAARSPLAGSCTASRWPRRAASGVGADLPAILPTLDFEGCGSSFSLIGVPGKNPVDPNDFFWQHHAAMYYDLLEGHPDPDGRDADRRRHGIGGGAPATRTASPPERSLPGGRSRISADRPREGPRSR